MIVQKRMVGVGLTSVIKLIKAVLLRPIKISYGIAFSHLITLRVEGCGSFSKIGYYSVNCARTFFATIICVRKIFWQNHMVKLYVGACEPRTTSLHSFHI